MVYNIQTQGACDMSKKAKLLATRKEFLSGAAAVGAAPFVRTWGADGGKPLWKAGLMTDTHVHKTMESCSRVRAACELFAKHEVDLVVNCGDIADLYYPTGFQSLRKVYSESFRDRKLEEVWVYANHDRLRRKEPWQEVMKDVRRLLEIPHEPYASIDFKGYPLIVFPQWLNYERAKAMLDEACAKYPGKPVFVFDHIPPQASNYFGQSKSALIYELFSIHGVTKTKIYKISRVPSPRNPAVYKTNLTNRHEKILMSFAKVTILN